MQVKRRRHLSAQIKQELTGEQTFFWSQIPRLVSTGVAKCSLALLAHDLKGVCNQNRKAKSIFSLGVVGLWMLGAPMIATVGCAPSRSGAWSPYSTTVSEDAARTRPSH